MPDHPPKRLAVGLGKFVESAQGYTDVRCGSVTFIQRFGSALNLHPHFHVLMLDGVYVVRAEGATPEFVPAPALKDSNIQRIVEIAPHRLVRFSAGRGAERSRIDTQLSERGRLSGRSSGHRSGSSSPTARVGPGFLR